MRITARPIILTLLVTLCAHGLGHAKAELGTSWDEAEGVIVGAEKEHLGKAAETTVLVSDDSKEGASKGDHISEFGVRHVVGIILACIGLMIAAGGGIGGGGILVPIYIMVMGFSPKYGIPLSNITILGGAVANNYFNVFKRHPNKTVNRAMIDYDLVLLMEPPTIAGAVLGTILNKVLPEFVITTLLVLVLGATAYKTWNTGLKLLKKEEEKLAKEGTQTEPLTWGETFSTLCSWPEVDDTDDSEGKPLMGSDTKDEIEVQETTAEMKAILDEDAQLFPLWKIGAITVCFILVVISNILKLSVASCGSPLYWVLLMAPVGITVGMMFMVRSYLLQKGEIRRASNYQLVDGDVDWNETTTITYPLVCTAAGLFAGLFGIGGGVVKGPLMLEMGIIPEVSAATAAYMILYTAASATVTYAAFGQVKVEFSLILFPCGLLFTALGQIMINGYIKKTNHASIVAFIIASVVGLSTLLMGYQSGVTAYDQIQNGVTLKGICETAVSNNLF